MADNLSVSITGDATQLNVATEVAKQYVKDYAAAVKSLAAEMKSTGSASQALSQRVEDTRLAANRAKVDVTALQVSLAETRGAGQSAAQGLEQTAEGAAHAASGSAAVTREFIVMGHEALQGRFSRIPGSMMVLAEHTGALSAVTALLTPTVIGAGVAIGALAGALAYLTIRANEAEVAMRGVYNAALLQGRSAAVAEAGARQMAASMQQLGVGHTEALDVATAISKLGNMSDETRAKLAALAPDLLKVLNPDDADKAAEVFQRTFGNTSALKSFVDENHLLTVEQQNAFAAAVQAKDAYAAQDIALDALKTRIGGVAAQQKQADDAYYEGVKLRMAGVTGLATNIMSGYDKAGAAVLTFQNRLQQNSSGMAPSASTLQANAVEQQYLGTLRERQKLETDLATMQKALGAATTDAERQDLAAAIKVNEARQAELKSPGTSNWATQIEQQAQAAGNAAVTSAASAGAKREAITEAETRAEVAVYQAASKDMSRTDEERQAMAARAIQLHMSLVKEDAAASTTAAKKSAQDVIAGYDQQISEARGNVVQIEAIETQKLSFLSQTYGQASSEYKRALTEQTTALREAVTQQSEDIKQAGTQQIADRKAELDLELAQHTVTKTQELQAEMQFADQTHAGELTSLDDLIATLSVGTSAYVAAMKERHNLDVQFQLDHAQSLAAIQAAENAAAQKADQTWTQAFNRIGSTFESSTASLIMGRESYLKVEQKVAQEVIQFSLQVAMHWIATEAAKTAASLVGASARVAADQAEGNSGFAAVVVTALKDIAAYAGETFGGVFAFLAPTMGPAAAGPAAAAYASVTAMSGGLAEGTTYVPHDMMTMIHQGEAVVPKYDADVMRGGGGGGHTFNYSPTINGGGAAVSRQVQANHEDFKRYIAQVTRNGQIALPGRPQVP